MSLFGHMRIHESGTDRSLDTPSTSFTSTMPSSTHTPSPSTSTISSSTTASISEIGTDTADFSCPHCPRICTSHIGRVGHPQIHHTETGEPMPGAPVYTRRIRLNCPHCSRTFTYLMGLHEVC
ncbi:hypothetical protein SprV_0602158900 [Sparganum proliferum]